MQVHHKVLVLAALLAGCSSSDPTSTTDAPTGPGDGRPGMDFTSGSRLKARYLVAEDGSRTLLGWHDSMLDVNCSFQLAEDGARRCLPEDLRPSSIRAFSDASCTNEVFYVSSTCDPTPPAYVGMYIHSTVFFEACANTIGIAVYKLGPESVLSSSYGQVVGGTDCDGPHAGTSTESRFFTGTHVPPETFVKMTEEVVDP